jgi:hypothetical protein
MLLPVFLATFGLLFAPGLSQGTKGGRAFAASNERPSYGVKSPSQAAESRDREAALPAFVEPPAAPNPEPDDAASEPGMPYSFSYEADATDGRSARSETSDGTTVRGSYMLAGPDGIERVVHYIADKDGFRATITTNEPGTESQSPSGVLLNSSQLPASEIALQYGPGEPARRQEEPSEPVPVQAVFAAAPILRQPVVLAAIEQPAPVPVAPVVRVSPVRARPQVLRAAPVRQQAPIRPLSPIRQAAPVREASLSPSFNAQPRPSGFGFRSEVRHDAVASIRDQAVKGAAPTQARKTLLQAPVKQRPQAPIVQVFRAPVKAPPPPPPRQQPIAAAQQPILVLQRPSLPQAPPRAPPLPAAPLPILRSSGKVTLQRNPRPFFAAIIPTTAAPVLVFDEQQQRQEEEPQQQEQVRQEEDAEPSSQQQHSQEEEPEPQQQEQQQQLVLDEPQQRQNFF